MVELKAVIQAGGEGTRLAPYSTVLPKALMPIGEGTVIDSMLKLLADAGVSTVYITVSKLGHLIRSYCGDGSRWGLEIVYVDESKPLGTIGPLDPIRDHLDGTFIVANSDIYIDLDIAETGRDAPRGRVVAHGGRDESGGQDRVRRARSRGQPCHGLPREADRTVHGQHRRLLHGARDLPVRPARHAVRLRRARASDARVEHADHGLPAPRHLDRHRPHRGPAPRAGTGRRPRLLKNADASDD